jgi:lipopolysaccharide/colanic/teichoic acid biosynthesis glycosyltransferase
VAAQQRLAWVLPFSKAEMPPTEVTAATFAPALSARRSAERVDHAQREKARRALNVAVAAIGLALAAPVMALIAVAIRLTSRGPVIYRQTRIGIDQRRHFGGNHRRLVDCGGRPFTMFKFRTMTDGSGGEQTERWASPTDPRTTAVGRVLRKYRLDELPQLFNVLMGDMNVVGPRPEQPGIFASLRAQIPAYPERQRVRPGITGWAQINHHYDTCLDDVRRKVSYDLEYVARHSLAEDLKIMLKTIPTVAFKRGAW